MAYSYKIQYYQEHLSTAASGNFNFTNNSSKKKLKKQDCVTGKMMKNVWMEAWTGKNAIFFNPNLGGEWM